MRCSRQRIDSHRCMSSIKCTVSAGVCYSEIDQVIHFVRIEICKIDIYIFTYYGLRKTNSKGA